MQDDQDIPVYKVGAVILRQRPDAGHTSQGNAVEGDTIEALIVRPHPTQNNGTLPNLALPRGSRKFDTGKKDEHGNVIWQDIRNLEDAKAAVHRRWEPVAETLLREMKEEAGIQRADLLKSADVYEMEERPYASPGKGETYPVYWYVVWADDAMIKNMDNPPEHSSEARWCTLNELKNLVSEEHPEHSQFSKGYYDVVKEAIMPSVYESLKPANLKAQQVKERQL